MGRSLRRSHTVVVLSAIALVVGFVNLGSAQLRPTPGENGLVCLYEPTPEEKSRWAAEQREQELAMKGDRFHEPLHLYVDFPGVHQPELPAADEVDLPESTSIAGVEVNGQHCAFVLDEMKDPARHVVNLVMNHQAISVTYCDLVDCVRVLRDDAKTPIPLHVGGLDINRQMVFLLNGQRYGQASLDLPLADHPFVRMTWGDWRRLHPNTRVYLDQHERR